MAINPEAKIFAQLEREEGPPQEILTPAEVYVERVIYSQMERDRPRFEDFRGPDVLNDKIALKNKLAEEERLRGRTYVERSRRGRLAETLIYHCAEMHNWFSQECATVPASEFDDHLNGTDIVFEFDRGDKVVRLAVDVTIASNINDKKNEVLSKVESGALTELKYFISAVEDNPDTGKPKQGRMVRIPKVILHMDVPTVQRLCRLLADNKRAELARSNVQNDLIFEVRLQLEEQIAHAQKYCLKMGKDPSPVVKRLQEVLAIIQEIEENKKESSGAS